MSRSHHNPDDMYTPYEAPYGKAYNQVSVKDGAKQIHIAGTVAKNEASELVGVDDMGAQVEKTMENIGTSLEAVDATPDDVVRINEYTVDMERYLHEGHQHVVEFFGRDETPASTLLGVDQLADTFAGVADGEPTDIEPHYLIEIDVTAVV